VARHVERPTDDPVQRLFSLSVDMLGTASAEGFFTRLNPAWEQCLGWTSEQLMAAPFISFVHPDDVDATVAVAAGLSGPGSRHVVAFENRYRAPAATAGCSGRPSPSAASCTSSSATSARGGRPSWRSAAPRRCTGR
jgi:PAS domain-containing protein